MRLPSSATAMLLVEALKDLRPLDGGSWPTLSGSRCSAPMLTVQSKTGLRSVSSRCAALVPHGRTKGHQVIGADCCPALRGGEVRRVDERRCASGAIAFTAGGEPPRRVPPPYHCPLARRRRRR